MKKLPLLIVIIPTLDSTLDFTHFSPPEPKAHRWAYRIPMVRRPSSVRPSSVRRSQFQTSSSPKALGQSKPNFMWSLLGKGERKFVRGIWVTWPRWPPRRYIVKTLQYLLLQNWWTDFHETWYVASGTPAHHNLFKWWPWVDLDLFYGKVKFGNLGVSIRKMKTWFFRTFAACDLKPTEKMNICEYWRSRSFLDLGPRSFTYKT